MSGHSKWATIKRQKGVNDIKKGQVFTKISRAITAAVLQGGGVTDPESNFKLRLAIESARSANMPKDNVERAIQRAAGKQEANMEEVIYEGFGPGGFSVIVEGFTDNKQRTVSDVKNVFEKNGGSLGSPGSVMYQFEQKGLVTTGKSGKTADDIFMIAADQMAEDVEEAGEEMLIYTRPEDLARVRNGLATMGMEIKGAELLWKPIVLYPISEKEAASKAFSFMEKLEELDDVQKVYANFDIPDNIIKQVE